MGTQKENPFLSSGTIREHAAAIVSDMSDAISIQDREFRVLYQNDAHKELVGDRLGEFCYRAYAGTDRICRECPVERSFSDGGQHTQERHVVRDRRELHLEIAASALRDANGRVVAGVEVIRNIGERWLSEQALREERNFVAAVLDTVDSLVVVLDREGRIVRFNRACEQLTGYGADEVRGKHVWDLFILPEEVAGVRSVFQDLKAGMFPNRHVNSWRVRDGSRRLIFWSNTALLNNNGDVQYVVPTGIDITERKRNEDALAAEKEQLSVTLRSIGDGVITTDREGRIVLLNAVAEELTGWPQSEAAGRPIEEVFHIVHEKTRKRVPAPIAEVIGSGKTAELANHTVLIGRHGREYVIADSAAPIQDARGAIFGVVLVFRDETEKRFLQQEAIKSQKMESLGILAGGIAHDYNNLLMAILGNINLAGILLSRGETARALERMSDAERASHRAKDLTRQLLTFSRGGTPMKKAADAGELVREAVSLSVRGVPVNAEVSVAPDLLKIDADEGQISQVLNNLLINAVQSFGGREGTIVIRCENRVVADEEIPTLSAGNYVWITVRDSGCGIPSEHLSRVFDPYFSTKEKGVGLGLATSYSIVKQHDGLIAVESKVGQGTVFHLYLPAAAGTAGAASSPGEQHVHGEGRVLVMDDEESVRRASEAMLLHLGYSVETASDGADAVRRYAAAIERGAPFSVVVMDATVPGGMGGRDAIRELLKIDPAARAVLTSGYTSDDLLAQHREHGFKDVIQKPYTMVELGAVIRRVLGS